MKTLAEKLRHAMELRNLKQADLCKMTGIGKSSISTYLSGEYEPKQKNLVKIANALRVNANWLMGEDYPMTGFRIDYSKAEPTEEELRESDELDRHYREEEEQYIARLEKFVELYSNLSSNNKGIIDQLMKSLKDKQEP